MTKEEYKECIIQMVEKIDNEQDLNRVFFRVHSVFIHRTVDIELRKELCSERQNKDIL